MNGRLYQICVLCLILGAVLPWGLLLFGAGIATAFQTEWASRLSAYSAASGLALMAASFLMARTVNFLRGR